MSDDRCFRCLRDIVSCACKCDFCKEPMVELIEFEAGNNAEFPVEIALCEEHFKLHEENYDKFMDEFGGKIDDAAYDRLIDSADR